MGGGEPRLAACRQGSDFGRVDPPLQGIAILPPIALQIGALRRGLCLRSREIAINRGADVARRCAALSGSGDPSRHRL
jgi:hypothetical protein